MMDRAPSLTLQVSRMPLQGHEEWTCFTVGHSPNVEHGCMQLTSSVCRAQSEIRCTFDVYFFFDDWITCIAQPCIWRQRGPSGGVGNSHSHASDQLGGPRASGQLQQEERPWEGGCSARTDLGLLKPLTAGHSACQWHAASVGCPRQAAFTKHLCSLIPNAQCE